MREAVGLPLQSAAAGEAFLRTRGQLRPLPTGTVTFLDGGVRLVGLFEQVRHEALVRLLCVPGTTAGRAQPVHDGHDLEQPRPWGVRHCAGGDAGAPGC